MRDRDIVVDTLRIELACALRWAARLDWHEATANHFSVVTSRSGERFLVNPEGMHFGEIRASDLIEVEASASERPQGIDPTAWAIHGAMHRQGKKVGCILHTHSPYATALASVKTPELPPVDQNAMRFFGHMIVDEHFGGMGLDEEAERLGSLAGRAPILLLGNHGVIASGPGVAEAFDSLYYFERACRNYLIALASGLPLNPVSDSVAKKTAAQWKAYVDQGASKRHFAALMRILDREAPDYRS